MNDLQTINDKAAADALVRDAIHRSKREVLADIAEGTVPATVRNFSELHDHVDANEYGGLCEDERFDRIRELEEATGRNLVDEVQNAVDEWLRDGRPLRHTEAAEEGDECRACGRTWDELLATVSPENPDAADEWGHHMNVAGDVRVVASCSEVCATWVEARRKDGMWLNPADEPVQG